MGWHILNKFIEWNLWTWYQFNSKIWKIFVHHIFFWNSKNLMLLFLSIILNVYLRLQTIRLKQEGLNTVKVEHNKCAQINLNKVIHYIAIHEHTRPPTSFIHFFSRAPNPFLSVLCIAVIHIFFCMSTGYFLLIFYILCLHSSGFCG